VHTVVLGLVVASVLLVLLTPGIVPVPLAAVMLLLALVLRPRLGRLPKDAAVRRRPDSPALFALLDRVAAEVGARPAELLVISKDYNASYGRVGVRRTPLVTVGLPLWDALDGRQRIAVLAHEFAHDVNGDSRHGLVVGSALRSLETLHSALRPGGRPTRGVMLKAAQRALQVVVAGVHKAMLRLVLRAGQRAEYLADELAGNVAGPSAAAEALDVLSTTSVTHLAQMQRFALAGQRDDFWDDRRRAFAGIPESERERRRRLGARERWRVDSTHPPSSLRIAALRGRADAAPRVLLGPGEEERIQEELAADYPRVAQELLDDVRSSLYR
jgi:Zn-dependent protease with chaperone function